MPARLGPAFRRARNSWAAIVVVLAGVISALAAVADLTRWVSVAAAVAAVLGGSRVLFVELVVPLRMDAVDEATAVITTNPMAIDGRYTNPSGLPIGASPLFRHGVEVGTAVHVGSGRWITSANLALARFADAAEAGRVWLRLGNAVVAGQVIHLSPNLGLALVQATQAVEHRPGRLRLAKEQPGAGDRVRIVGWSLPHGMVDARRLSVELHTQGVLGSGALLLTGPHLPVGFIAAPAIDSRTGRIVGLVRSSQRAAESETLNEVHVLPVSALLADEAVRAWLAGVR